MRLLFFFLLLCFAGETAAQDDALFISTRGRRKAITCYPPTNNGTVSWAKRIWCTIDLQEEVNYPFVYDYSGDNFIDVIKKALLADPPRLNAYADEQFTTRLTPEEIRAILEEYVELTDSFGTPIGAYKRELTTESYKLIHLKEDWYFDKSRSVLDVRIVGLCPLGQALDSKGTNTAVPFFWIYYPELEPLLQKTPAHTRSSLNYSLADLFHKRLFGSTILKETNIYEPGDQQHTLFLDASLAADRAKAGVEMQEQRLWNF